MGLGSCGGIADLEDGADSSHSVNICHLLTLHEWGTSGGSIATRYAMTGQAVGGQDFSCTAYRTFTAGNRQCSQREGLRVQFTLIAH